MLNLHITIQHEITSVFSGSICCSHCVIFDDRNYPAFEDIFLFVTTLFCTFYIRPVQSVPIVRSSTNILLNENWKKLETKGE